MEAVRLGIFVAVLRHFGEDRFGVALEYRQFEQQRGVEHDIRFLLERVDPLLFTTAHRGAAVDRVAC